MKQAITGTIKLYSKGGTEIVERSYTSARNREEILQYWKGLYGRHFKTMYYQISPNLSKLEYEEELRQMIELREQGCTYKEIGSQLGYTRQAVGKRFTKLQNKAA